MKKLITLLAVTASFAVLAPATAQAFDGHGSSRSFSNNCGSCGTPVEQAMAFYCTHCGTRLAEGGRIAKERRGEPGSTTTFFRDNRGQ